MHNQLIEREHREHREQNDLAKQLVNEIINPWDDLPNDYPQLVINRPCYQSHDDWVEINGKKLKPGLYYHGKRTSEGKLSEFDEWISSPLKVNAITSSPNKDNFGRQLHFQDSNGQWHDWAMPMHLLKGNGDELRGELLNQGVVINPKKRNDLINYIMTQSVKDKVTAVEQTGWYERNFVLPKQIIGQDRIIYQSDHCIGNDYQSKGTLSGWQSEIGRYCQDNIPLMVSVCAALAGPLLNLLNRQQGGGIHWVGDSSCGKSTAVEIAASVWGGPDFVRSWSATANGLEGVATKRNDTCLILDEIDEASPYEIGKIAYMLANGQGKQRAGRVGNARSIKRWRLITLSTGERTMSSIMNQIGKKTNAGQLVRLISIPAKFEHGCLSNLHGFESGRALADHLKTVRANHYGHLGPAFIKKLLDEDIDIGCLFAKIHQLFNNPANTHLEQRASSLFSIMALAGELATQFQLLPWASDDAVEACLIAFTRAKDYLGPGQTEDNQILRSVSEYLARHGDSRFSVFPEQETKIINNRAGWYKEYGLGRVYMFHPVALTEAGDGFERSRIVEALKKNDWLVDMDADRCTKKTRTPVGMKNLYHIYEPEDW